MYVLCKLFNMHVPRVLFYHSITDLCLVCSCTAYSHRQDASSSHHQTSNNFGFVCVDYSKPIRHYLYSYRSHKHPVAFVSMLSIFDSWMLSYSTILFPRSAEEQCPVILFYTKITHKQFSCINFT